MAPVFSKSSQRALYVHYSQGAKKSSLCNCDFSLIAKCMLCVPRIIQKANISLQTLAFKDVSSAGCGVDIKSSGNKAFETQCPLVYALS